MREKRIDLRRFDGTVHLGVLADVHRAFQAVHDADPAKILMTREQAVNYRDCLAEGRTLTLLELEYKGAPVEIRSKENLVPR